MDREVTLVLVRSDDTTVGALPSFTVGTRWWPDVADVVEACRAIYGVDVTILRLLDAQPATPRGGMGGKVTYTAEFNGVLPAATRPWTSPLPDDPLRARWARPGGPAHDLAWADEQLIAVGRPRLRPAIQMKTWNLSSIWRLPTSDGDVWFKAVPPFFAHEGAVIHALAAPTLPPLVAFDDLGRTLLEDVPGEVQFRAPPERHAAMIDALVELQAGTLDRIGELLAAGAPDWRAAPFALAAADVVERGGVGLDTDQRRILDRLVASLDDRFSALAECGIPDTFVHGDFHTGNVRWTDAGPVIFDWGDCGIGNPLFDLPAFDRNLAAEHRPAARARWIEQWTLKAPGSDAARAVALIAPIAAVRLAVIYQVFLDGIERTEQIYHEDDVAAQLRVAARLAIEERPS
ncbi:MAG TPA: aminoglycoside phosphotransferase family protein [Candidatus Limnocylindria bacterium]